MPRLLGHRETLHTILPGVTGTITAATQGTHSTASELLVYMHATALMKKEAF
jgi:hypothetical protein